MLFEKSPFCIFFFLFSIKRLFSVKGKVLFFLFFILMLQDYSVLSVFIYCRFFSSSSFPDINILGKNNKFDPRGKSRAQMHDQHHLYSCESTNLPTNRPTDRPTDRTPDETTSFSTHFLQSRKECGRRTSSSN